MSGEAPIRITKCDGYNGLNCVIIGIGDQGENILNKIQTLSTFMGTDSAIQNIFICDDGVFRYDECKVTWRDNIMKEIAKSDIIFSLINTDIQEDFKSACNIAKICADKNKDVFSVCVFCGNNSCKNVDVLKALYTTIIYVEDVNLLSKVCFFLTNMMRSNIVGIDFADITAILQRVYIGYWGQFSLTSIDDLPIRLLDFKTSVVDHDCANYHQNIALIMIEAATSTRLEDIDEVVTALYEFFDNVNIVWNIHFVDDIEDKYMKVSMVYGRDEDCTDVREMW